MRWIFVGLLLVVLSTAVLPQAAQADHRSRSRYERSEVRYHYCGTCDHTVVYGHRCNAAPRYQPVRHYRYQEWDYRPSVRPRYREYDYDYGRGRYSYKEYNYRSRSRDCDDDDD